MENSGVIEYNCFSNLILEIKTSNIKSYSGTVPYINKSFKHPKGDVSMVIHRILPHDTKQHMSQDRLSEFQAFQTLSAFVHALRRSACPGKKRKEQPYVRK